jgi:hypothetical protein
MASPMKSDEQWLQELADLYKRGVSADALLGHLEQWVRELVDQQHMTPDAARAHVQERCAQAEDAALDDAFLKAAGTNDALHQRWSECGDARLPTSGTTNREDRRAPPTGTPSAPGTRPDGKVAAEPSADDREK